MIKNKEGNTFKKMGICFLIILILCIILLILIKKLIYPLEHFDIVKEEAAKNNLDPYLIMAIIKTESGFNNEATSSKQAKGLMQIMNSTATDINNKENVVDEVGDQNIYDANINIALGCKYFKSLINKYNGNYYLAICAYNAGMGNVDKWINENIISTELNDCNDINLPYKETQKYLKKVINSYKMYRILYK